MPLQAVAGSKFFIGTAPMNPASSLNAASFAGVTWVEVKAWNTAGPLGEESSAITYDLIGDDIQQTVAGTETPPAIDQTFGLDYGDPGQVAIVAARKSKANYPFKVTFGDGTTTPTTRLFVGIVLTAREEMGQSNAVKQLVTSIRRNSNLVRVAAT